jgi:hypothetical protein
MSQQPMPCVLCDSTDLRKSHLRLSDLGQLLRLMYPVRCRICYERQFVPMWKVFTMSVNRSTLALTKWGFLLGDWYVCFNQTTLTRLLEAL